jgi:hypothetical protein
MIWRDDRERRGALTYDPLALSWRGDVPRAGTTVTIARYVRAQTIATSRGVAAELAVGARG